MGEGYSCGEYSLSGDLLMIPLFLSEKWGGIYMSGTISNSRREQWGRTIKNERQ
jgi:hypothetical protein